jgi:hypothetical protein
VYRGLYGQGEVEASSRCCLVIEVDLPSRGRGKCIDVGIKYRYRHWAGASNKVINKIIKILLGSKSLIKWLMKQL